MAKSTANKISATDVANILIEQMRKGTAPWQRSWQPNEIPFHHNPTSNASYQGMNQITLMAVAEKQGYEDTRWVTYKQAQSVDANVKKGEKGVRLSYYGPMSKKKYLTADQASGINFNSKGEAKFFDQNGDGVIVRRLDDGRIQEETIKWQAIPFTVFNAEQIDNLPERDIHISEEQRNERVKGLVDSLGPDIRHDDPNRCFYRIKDDFINLPEQTQFESPERYYQAMLHEIAHWTGAESRLDRHDLEGRKGSAEYAREGLRAEMAAFLMSGELGLGYDPSSSDYVAAWLTHLDGNKKEVFAAANDVNKIQSYVMKHDPQRELEMTNENKNDQTQESNNRPEISEFPTDKGGWQESDYFKHIQYMNADHPERSYLFLDNEDITYAPDVETSEAAIFAKYNESIQYDESNHAYFIDKSSPEYTNLVEDANRWFVPSQDWEKERQLETEQISDKRIYLNVPKSEKDEAKALGAKWDWGAKKQWYVPEGTPLEPFDKWNPDRAQEQETEKAAPTQEVADRVDLKVPFDDVAEAKEAGAKWDWREKTWYINADQDGQQFDKWKRDYEPNVSPQDGFAQALESAGLQLDGPPLLDGQWHNVPVENDKPGERSGSYRGFSDGVPNGMIVNFKEDPDRTIKWVHQSAQLTSEVRESMRESNEQKAERREAEKAAILEKAYEKFSNLKEQGLANGAYESHPYLESKGIQGSISNTYVDRGNLHIPLTDRDGRCCGMQYIHGQAGTRNVYGKELEVNIGDKSYVRGSVKEGSSFYFPAQMGKHGGTVLIAEGFATAAALNQKTGLSTFAAFDSGNLKAVAEHAREQLPEANILIVADNDKPSKHHNNIGVEKAEEAALAVDGQFTYMDFTQEDKANGLSDFVDFMQHTSESAAVNYLIAEIEHSENMHELGVKANEYVDAENNIVNKDTGAKRDLINMERDVEHAIDKGKEQGRDDGGYEL